MQWANGENAGFSTASPEELYLPVNQAEGRPSVAEQQADPNSLFNRVRELISLRQKYQALDADANFDVLFAESGKLPFVYAREKDGQNLIIALNPSNRRVSVVLPEKALSALPEVVDSSKEVSITKVDSGWQLTLGPISGGIFDIS